MDGEYNWNAAKKDLWKKKPQDLMIKLQELDTEKLKLEQKLHLGKNRAGYPAISGEKTSYRPGNLRKVRKQIACIKTMLNVKLKHNPVNKNKKVT